MYSLVMFFIKASINCVLDLKLSTFQSQSFQEIKSCKNDSLFNNHEKFMSYGVCMCVYVCVCVLSTYLFCLFSLKSEECSNINMQFDI